jgi:two-component system cell cycle sensor histidine kinase/response regulator CckA
MAIENVYIDTTLKGYDVVREGDYVKLTMTDDGIGIAESDLERIFEPFFTKKKMGRSGTGLGMAVVWGTVKDHSGYIDVQSRQGQGSTFSLYLPLSRENQTTRKSLNAMDIRKGKGQSILVVDDIAEQREIAVIILSRLGYAPTAVQNGTEAVAYIQDHAVDLLLLEMIMEPGMDGLDTYRQILDIRPGTPAVIASRFAETDRVREVQNLGACRYIRKPYTIENIAQAVQEALVPR